MIHHRDTEITEKNASFGYALATPQMKNQKSFLCALCASVVRLSVREEFIENRHDLACETGQTFVSIINALVRIHRGDQPHQRPVRPLARERIPEVVPFQLPGVGQHPVALGEPEVGKLVWGTFLPEGPVPAG